MLESNPNIKEITNKEVLDKVHLLRIINCSDSQIISIISSNSLFLEKTNDATSKLIKYLLEIGFKTLNILFDSNPYILNLEPFEIEGYIKKRLSNNELLENIIDDLDSNPHIFSEL